VNPHNKYNCNITGKLISLDIQIMHFTGGECFAHEHCWGSIEENFISIFRSFPRSGECLLTRITQEGLKKAESVQSSDHFPEVAQELLWKD